MLNLVIPYTVVVTLIVAFVVLVVLVNKNVVMKYSNNAVKRFVTKPLVRYSLRRCGSALISLALAIAVTFCLLRIQDKQYFCDIEGGWIKYDKDIRAALCEMKLNSLGLNDPVIVQLLNYFYDIIPFPKNICMTYRVDITSVSYLCSKSEWKLIYLNTSTVISPKADIATMFARTMPNSFAIGLGGLVIETFIGYPMGVFMAKYKNRWFDRFGNAYIILVGSIPGLVYYYLLQGLFIKVFHLPLIWQKGDVLSYLPAILTLGIGGVAGIALWVRRYMVDEFGGDYVKFARAKGVPENSILFKHVLRNAVVPLIRSIPAGVIYCMLGSYFVEVIYGVEGFGRMLVDGVQRDDFPIVQAAVVISALITVIANLVGDITTAIADPRISFTAKD